MSESPVMAIPALAQFARFARQKQDAAAAARLEPFTTIVDRTADRPLERIGSRFTEALLDGPFFQSPPPPSSRPGINLVFVQSAGGNTEADDPSTLGGGETDKHVIYEGLSRVAADAVMAGAKTVGDGSVIFSVWHPALVALRQAFGRPRHLVQIVMTRSGELPIEQGLLFNVPEIAVVILTADRAATALSPRVRSRPWISVVSSGTDPDLHCYAKRLRADLGIVRISAIGGRILATSLIEAGLVSDLYLTTSPIEAGTPGSPMFGGTQAFRRELVVRKRSQRGVVFEQFVLPPSVDGASG